MALREAVRTTGERPVEYRDKLVRCVMKAGPENTVELWGEWEIDLGNGQYAVHSARCDLRDEQWILALPNMQQAIERVKTSSHAKVKAAIERRLARRV